MARASTRAVPQAKIEVIARELISEEMLEALADEDIRGQKSEESALDDALARLVAERP